MRETVNGAERLIRELSAKVQGEALLAEVDDERIVARFLIAKGFLPAWRFEPLLFGDLKALDTEVVRSFDLLPFDESVE